MRVFKDKVFRCYGIIVTCYIVVLIYQSAHTIFKPYGKNKTGDVPSSTHNPTVFETTPKHFSQKKFKPYGKNKTGDVPSSTHNPKVFETKPKHVSQKKSAKCVLGRLPPHLEQLKDTHPPDVTIVTAYFNLGKLKKSGRESFEPHTYMKWAKSFEHLMNPTVFYTDSPEIERQMTKIRGNLKNITKIIRLDRKSMWSFKLVGRIRKIFSIPGYPKHQPNTVLPEYSCVQHAKYDCLEDSVSNDYFHTTYVTWLDVGYFRYVANRKRNFRIVPPRDFDKSRVAMNQVNTVNMTELVDVIIKGNHVWVGGGIVFGIGPVIQDFVKDYRQAVERYISMNIMNTDQQVIFAMNTKSEKKILKSKVQIQLYKSDVDMDCWFYLGYSCYREII